MTKSPGWIPTLALIVAGMMLSSLVSIAATSALGFALWGKAVSPASPGGGGNVAEDSWASTASTISPSTVSLQVQAQGGTAEGSGVVYSSKGEILTNAHVVAGAQKLTVTLADGRIFPGTVTGADTSTDLALVRIDNPPRDLTPATFANSSQLEVGQDVMAVGTPLGLANTATTGIVSALNRPVVTAQQQGANPQDASFTSAIQTDASINPGNSGGPLVNRAGEVVGINSSIASNAQNEGSAGSIGLGFAIPSNTAQNIAEQLSRNGKAMHPVLGVRVTDGTARDADTAYRGAAIDSVEPGTLAEQAGIKEGDVIVKVDEVSIGSAAALTAQVRSLKLGSTHTITLYRGDKQETVDVTLK